MGEAGWVISSCGASVGCLMKYHRDLREPLVWRQENPVFHSSCKLELGIALQSLQGKIDLIYACVQDLVFHYWAYRDLRVVPTLFHPHRPRTHLGRQHLLLGGPQPSRFTCLFPLRRQGKYSH